MNQLYKKGFKEIPFFLDLFSHESIRQPGIYAMGPLVGDNFVRFLQGGALAISNHILKKKYRKDI